MGTRVLRGDEEAVEVTVLEQREVGDITAQAMPAEGSDGQRRVKEAIARGEKVGVWGPSPGFRDLRWIRPVLAGDTIAFSTGIESKRASDSRPGWGIVQARTGGVNQRGEDVYSIRATAFVPLRDAAA